MKIAADLIVKNEEDYIEHVVASIAPYIDTIFITDTGSIDATKGIIKTQILPKYDNIVYNELEWTDNYSDIHNLVIDEIKIKGDYDYYLRVDADEIYFHSQLATLKDQLAKYPDQLAFQMPYINFHGGHKKLSDKPYDKKPNICKLKGYDVEYKGSVHEFIHINGIHIMSLANVDLEGNFFHHYSWCFMKRRYFKKLERIKCEKVMDPYNDSETQKEAIEQFYKQFRSCPKWQMKGDYDGPFPEVLEGTWFLENRTYSIDNSMDSPCVKPKEYCELQVTVDKWEISCSHFNYRKAHCL